ncbi:MAG TPA: PaaI family thioesterase [Candidatus Bathyarchaeia archaeon]|nr:PaaI family thioesterase [Candidatus Bathyarchaeia archaeon]
MPTVQGFTGHVKASFRKQAIMKLLGARITRLDRGVVEISAKNRPALSQQDGFVHAGALATLVDSAGGYATLSLLPAGSRVLSVELKLNFVRPAIGTIIRGTGMVRKMGRTISVCEIKAEMKQGQKWIECAWGIQTVYCIRNN